MFNMEILRSVTNGCVVLQLKGRIDLYNVHMIRDAIGSVIAEGGNKLIMNLENVTYIDSSGIGAFIGEQRKLKISGGGMKLVNVQGPVAQVFKLSRLYAFFDIHESEEEALAAFGE